MNDLRVEIDICYNDYYIEVYTIDRRDLDDFIQTLAVDHNKSFKIDDKVFWKKDLNSVSIAEHGLGFIYVDYPG